MAAGRRVLATGPLDEYAARVLGAFGEFVVAPDMREETLLSLMDEDVVALAIRGSAKITEAILARGTGLRVMGRSGVGYDTVDLAAANRLGIPLVFTPGAGARAVGEATFAFMLALTKLVGFWDRELKAGNWNSRLEAQGGDLDGATLGIVGFGRIGQTVAEMAAPFAMTVLAYDPFLDENRARALGARPTGLDDLMRQADFISIHCPLIPETRGLVDRRRLALVRPGSYLVNTSRGGVIESLDVLEEALADGRLAGVGLDVFDPSPPDVSHPLFRRANVLTSPHAMATTKGAMTRIFRSMADDMAAILRGETPRFVVNPEALGARPADA